MVYITHYEELIWSFLTSDLEKKEINKDVKWMN
jgi:hypothetical protein